MIDELAMFILSVVAALGVLFMVFIYHLLIGAPDDPKAFDDDYDDYDLHGPYRK